MIEACTNCSFNFDNRFCPQCGQKRFSGRITIKNTLGDALAGIFNIERGILFTILSLATRPGEMVSDYVSGAFKKYFNPFKFILLAATIGALTSYLSSTEEQMNQFLIQNQEPSEDLSRRAFKTELNQLIMDTVQDHYVLVSVAFLPFYAFFVALFFRRKGRNFAEHLVFVTYTQGFYTLAYGLVGTALLLLGADVITTGTLSFVFLPVYMSWAAKGFYRITWLGSIWRTCISHGLSVVLGITLFSIAAVAWLMIKHGPEIMERTP